MSQQTKDTKLLKITADNRDMEQGVVKKADFRSIDNREERTKKSRTRNGEEKITKRGKQEQGTCSNHQGSKLQKRRGGAEQSLILGTLIAKAGPHTGIVFGTVCT